MCLFVVNKITIKISLNTDLSTNKIIRFENKVVCSFIIKENNIDITRFAKTMMCRICHEKEPAKNLISPCHCDGSVKYIHQECLDHWIRVKGTLECELCRFKYDSEHIERTSYCQRIYSWTISNKELILFIFLSIIILNLMGLIITKAIFQEIGIHLSGSSAEVFNEWKERNFLTVTALITLVAYLIAFLLFIL